MKVDCDTLIMHILNPRATTKKIKHGDTVSKSIVEIKWNTKKIQSMSKNMKSK